MSYSTSHCSVENSVENMIRWSIKDWWFLWNTLHVHTLSVITTITAVSMATNVSHRRIYRSWAVLRAIIRCETMYRAWCTVLSKIVVLMCVLFFRRWRVKIPCPVESRPDFGSFRTRPTRWPWAPSSLPRSNYIDDENGTNDTDGTTRPQLTNDCEVGRWFDDLMRL